MRQTSIRSRWRTGQIGKSRWRQTAPRWTSHRRPLRLSFQTYIRQAPLLPVEAYLVMLQVRSNGAASMSALLLLHSRLPQICPYLLGNLKTRVVCVAFRLATVVLLRLHSRPRRCCQVGNCSWRMFFFRATSSAKEKGGRDARFGDRPRFAESGMGRDRRGGCAADPCRQRHLPFLRQG